jgi:hypothetical protein
VTQVSAVDPADEEAMARAWATADCVINATSEDLLNPGGTWATDMFKKYIYPTGTFWQDKSPEEIQRIING